MDHKVPSSAHVQRNDISATGGEGPTPSAVSVSPQGECPSPPPSDDPETFKHECNNACQCDNPEDAPLLKCNGNSGALYRQNGKLLQSIDEAPSEDSDVEGGDVFKETPKPQRPKSIVKTASQHSFGSGRKVLLNGDMLHSPNGRSETTEAERPVLHVQFKHGFTDGSVSTAPREGCTSPAFSLDGSSSSSEDDSSLG